MLVFLCVLVHAIVHAHVCVRERKRERERVIKTKIMMSSAFTRGQGQKSAWSQCLMHGQRVVTHLIFVMKAQATAQTMATQKLPNCFVPEAPSMTPFAT